jgi:mono/diheme cytochrome c family protein
MIYSSIGKRFRISLAPVLGLSGLLGVFHTLANGPQDDGPDREERLLIGQQSFRDNCLMCHGEEMTSSQRLTAAQWKAEVAKMVGWGAPVPEEQRGPLIEYLVVRYPADAAPPASERITPEEIERLALPAGDSRPVRGDIAHGSTLYQAHCATCHGSDALGGDLGTNLVEKPVLLREEEFHQVVRQGRRRMPGFALALKPEQETDILAWLRTRTTASR